MKKNKYEKRNSGVLGRLLKELGKSKRLFILSLVFSLVSVSLSLYVPIIVGQTIDSLVGTVDFQRVISGLVKIAFLSLASALFRWLGETVNTSLSSKTVSNLRSKAYAKLSNLPVSFFDSTPKGEIISRIINDSDTVGDGLLLGMSQLFSGIVTIAATLIFMFRLNVKLTLLVILLTPLSIAVAAVIAKSTFKLFLRQSEKRASETSFLSESLKNIKLLKAFVREEKSSRDFEKITDEYAAASKKAVFASSLVNPATRFVSATIYAVLSLFGAFTVISGALSVGALTSLLSYAGQYSKPFNEISSVISELQNSLACASRIFDLCDREEITETSSEELEEVKGDVVFDNVSFSYTKNKPLLENVSFRIKAGQKAAVVGPTGCGKTTLINLLMRFYDVDSGHITVDGKDITSVTRDSLRAHFGMVLQDTFIFEDSVLANITLARPDASPEEAKSAAKRSHAHSFIRKLPNGYYTVLSENASELSEGEKQLLSITRVMLSSPEILILDEATSSIDTRTEKIINDAFSSMMKNKTSFIVAHRLSTIVNADLILVMKDGNIIETGTHEELMKKGGFYKELFESQFES